MVYQNIKYLWNYRSWRIYHIGIPTPTVFRNYLMLTDNINRKYNYKITIASKHSNQYYHRLPSIFSTHN